MGRHGYAYCPSVPPAYGILFCEAPFSFHPNALYLRFTNGSPWLRLLSVCPPSLWDFVLRSPFLISPNACVRIWDCISSTLKLFEQTRISKWFSHSFIIYRGDAGINVELAVSSVSSLKYHVQEGILLLFFYGHVNPLYKTTA